MAISSARAFKTGSAPGSPRHTGQTFVFGGAPKPVGHPQKILVRVLSWTCTSNPMTGSYLPISSAVAMAGALEDMLHYKTARYRFCMKLRSTAPCGHGSVSAVKQNHSVTE